MVGPLELEEGVKLLLTKRSSQLRPSCTQALARYTPRHYDWGEFDHPIGYHNNSSVSAGVLSCLHEDILGGIVNIHSFSGTIQ